MDSREGGTVSQHRVPLLRAQTISKFYGRGHQRRQVLDQVSLALYEGSCLAIVGGSGSGKSTLVRILLGLEASEGTVTYRGKAVEGRHSLGYQALRSEAGLIFQNPFTSLDPRWSALRSVSEPLRIHAKRLVLSDEQIQQRSLAAMEAVGLDAQDFAGRFPRDCSGGQAQRIAVARAIVTRPRLLLADEPMSSLDVSARLDLIATFQKLRRDNPRTALILVSHDLGVVQHMADRILVLHNGRVQEEGTTNQVLSHPTSAYTRALLEAVSQ